MSFSSAFSSRFRRRYIGPVMAQAALAAGAGWSLVAEGMLVDGRLLIGPAGKVYAFKTPESAAKWAANTKGVGEREVLLMATIAPATAAAWKAKKREKLALVAARLVKAAGGAADDRKRAALLAESDYCLSKWQ